MTVIQSRVQLPDGRKTTVYSSRSHYDAADIAIRKSVAQANAKNARPGKQGADNIGLHLAIAINTDDVIDFFKGKPVKSKDRSFSPTVGQDKVKKNSDRLAKAKERRFQGDAAKALSKCKTDEDYKYFIKARGPKHYVERYSDGTEVYRSFKGERLTGKELEKAMGGAPTEKQMLEAKTLLAQNGMAQEPQINPFYTIKNRGRLEDVAKKTGVSLATLEQLNPALKGQRLTKNTQVRLMGFGNEFYSAQNEPSKTFASQVNELITKPALGNMYEIKNRGRLEDVAKRTGISLATLEQLNPDLKGQRLTKGVKVRLG